MQDIFRKVGEFAQSHVPTSVYKELDICCTAMVCFPDGTIVFGQADGCLEIYSEEVLFQAANRHYQKVTCLTVLNEEKFASGSSDKTIKTWDKRLGECLMTLSGHNLPLVNVLLLEDGETLVSLDLEEMKIWDSGKGECIKTVRLQTYSKNLTRLSNNLFALEGKGYKVWNKDAEIQGLEFGQKTTQLTVFKRRLFALFFVRELSRYVQNLRLGDWLVCFQQDELHETERYDLKGHYHLLCNFNNKVLACASTSMYKDGLIFVDEKGTRLHSFDLPLYGTHSLQASRCSLVVASYAKTLILN